VIDLEAPIIPAQQAGGIVLGTHIQEILEQNKNFFEVERDERSGALSIFRYRSASLDLWTNNDLVWQIMVHGNYAGKVDEKVGIGSTLADVKKSLGNIKVDTDEILVIGLPGISFEPEKDDDISPIVEIYIFEPDWTQLD
jgi:hypothetical protein